MAEAQDNRGPGTEARAAARSLTGPVAESGARPDPEPPPTPEPPPPLESSPTPEPPPTLEPPPPDEPPPPPEPLRPDDPPRAAGSAAPAANEPPPAVDRAESADQPSPAGNSGPPTGDPLLPMADSVSPTSPGDQSLSARSDQLPPTTKANSADRAAAAGTDKDDSASDNDSDAVAKAGAAGAAIDLDKPAAAAARARVTQVLRRANPAQAARTTVAWARRPAGRVILPAIIGLLLLAGAGTAGAYLVPKALKAGPAPAASPGFPLAAAPPGPAPSAAGDPLTGPSSAPPAPGAPIPGTGRPADALAGWAGPVGTRAGIPVVAVEAYGYAELVLAKTAPACHLSWTTIAAIGFVESGHGAVNNSVLNADATVRPPIFGLPLDGKGGRQLIADTDKGAIDGDAQFDRAVGPLQFIPSTWVKYGIDADNNGVIDPNDLDDASLAAATYLCAGGRDLSKADSWYDAILSYNAVAPYAAKVFQYANLYGQLSRV